MQPDLGRAVQSIADKTGKELFARDIFDCFMQEYVQLSSPYQLEKCHVDMDDDEEKGSGNHASIHATVRFKGKMLELSATGNGPVDAFVRGMQKSAGIAFTLENYAEHAVTRGADSQAAAYVGIRDAKGKEHFGAGIDPNIGIASIKAVLQAVNRMAAGR